MPLPAVVKSAVAGAGPTPSTSPPPSKAKVGAKPQKAAMTSQRVGLGPWLLHGSRLMLHDLRRHRVVFALARRRLDARADPPLRPPRPGSAAAVQLDAQPALQGRVRRLPIGRDRPW